MRVANKNEKKKEMKSNKGRIDIRGLYFGRLKVLFYYDTKRKHARWLCECACGNFKVIPGNHLRTGRARSCGCVNKTHGMTGKRIHGIWKNVMARCLWTHKDGRNFRRYKERGITVCDEWKVFEVFLKWSLDNGYRNGLTIDRINNDGPYSPENCRWATRREQSNNTSSNHYITFNGKTLSIADWSRETGIRASTIQSRIVRCGWTEEKALTTPIKIKGIQCNGNTIGFRPIIVGSFPAIPTKLKI